ncbi:MAG: hypothetical protein Pg6C_11430 [Treponemataceae bacterium]|nr:MAG: hypothetical protein Pg6C_11430 [Treponemataceae bacterium]
MAKMTDQEADYWDEYFTHNPPKLGPNGSGWLSRREARLLGMDDMAVNYLTAKAEAAHTSVGQVINELVREKVAASV